jgi:hypothetical protein
MILGAKRALKEPGDCLTLSSETVTRLLASALYWAQIGMLDIRRNPPPLSLD